MKKNIIFIVIVLTVLGIGIQKLFFSNQNTAKKEMKMPPALVKLTEIKKDVIVEKIETTGRVESVNTVDLVARVDGYLEKKFFNEGDIVKKGDILFLIEQDKYKINAQQAKADFQNIKANLDEAEKNLVRISELVEKDFISKAQYDNALAKRDSLLAALKAKKAQLKQADLNLEYTKIYSPISGKIGRIQISEGNYVNQLSGPIARIVSLDPIYVNFNLSIEDFLKIKTEEHSEKIAITDRKVEIKLPDNVTYSSLGKIKFFDNEVDASTGTIKLRAIFQNPDKILIPGQYVNVTVISPKEKAVRLIPQEAVLDSQKGKFVYTVDEKNIAQIRPVTVEKQYKDYWILESGLKDDEKIIFKGVQKVRPNAPVVLDPSKLMPPGSKPPENADNPPKKEEAKNEQ